MKQIGIKSVIVVFCLGLALGCQNTAERGNTGTADPRELEADERLEEPQVRDGVPEATVRDSLAVDTAVAEIADTIQ